MNITRKASAILIGGIALVGASLILPNVAMAADDLNSLPSHSQWLSDTEDAMQGGAAYLDANAGQPNPAIIMDIDNTALQTAYNPGVATPAVLNFANHASSNGYSVFAVTARTGDGSYSLNQLRNAGYNVSDICTRPEGGSTGSSKADCRAGFAANHTIVANVGNRPTDFEGGNNGKSYKLPDYNGGLS